MGFQNFEKDLETFAKSLERLCQRSLGSINKKILPRLSRFRSGCRGCFGVSVKKEKKLFEIFFQKMLNINLKVCKNDI